MFVAKIKFHHLHIYLYFLIGGVSLFRIEILLLLKWISLFSWDIISYICFEGISIFLDGAISNINRDIVFEIDTSVCQVKTYLHLFWFTNWGPQIPLLLIEKSQFLSGIPVSKRDIAIINMWISLYFYLVEIYWVIVCFEWYLYF